MATVTVAYLTKQKFLEAAARLSEPERDKAMLGLMAGGSVFIGTRPDGSGYVVSPEEMRFLVPASFSPADEDWALLGGEDADRSQF